MRPIVVSVSDASGGTKYSPWVRFDDWGPSSISIQCNVTGAVTYTVQSTLDDPNDPTNPVPVGSMQWVSINDPFMVNANITRQSNFMFCPRYARIVLSGGTGTVVGTFLQSSNGPY